MERGGREDEDEDEDGGEEDGMRDVDVDVVEDGSKEGEEGEEGGERPWGFTTDTEEERGDGDNTDKAARTIAIAGTAAAVVAYDGV